MDNAISISIVNIDAARKAADHSLLAVIEHLAKDSQDAKLKELLATAKETCALHASTYTEASAKAIKSA